MPFSATEIGELYFAETKRHVPVVIVAGRTLADGLAVYKRSNNFVNKSRTIAGERGDSGRPFLPYPRQCRACWTRYDKEEFANHGKGLKASICRLCKRDKMNARYQRLASAGAFVSRKSTKLKRNVV